MLEPMLTVETEETPRTPRREGVQAGPRSSLSARGAGEYKLRILREAAGAARSGEIAAMLRREGLYTSHLTAWRKQQDAGALRSLEPRKRGPSSEQLELRAVRAWLERAEADWRRRVG